MSSRRPSFLAPASAVLISWSSGAAGSQPPLIVDLDYHVDPALLDCPGETDFEEQVRSEVGYDAIQRGATHHVQARVALASPGIRGFVEWRDSTGELLGERELYVETADCSAFAPVMSFAIAVQIDLFNRGSGFQSEEAPAAEPSQQSPRPDLAERREEEQPRTVTKSRDRPWSLLVGAGPALRLGLTSRAVVEGRAFVLARSGSLAGEVGGEATLESREDTAVGGVDQQAILGSLGACASTGGFSGCLVGKAGRLRVQGVGVDVERSESGVIAQVGPRIAVWTELGDRWALGFRIDALVNLVPWTVTLDRREVWTIPDWGGAVGVDLAAVLHDNP